uniref:1-phosphatidylinositol 4-kinase n=1 Tax=Caenorhabditis japonica TaxID=281687 RepID=A0A8R1HZJ3_CAEJA
MRTRDSAHLFDLWEEEGVPLYLRPYKIVCIGCDAGLIEPVLDTLSLHQIKRNLNNLFRKNGVTATPTLRNHFENLFGSISSETYVNAQKKFIQSTAAYSLVSYFLQLKDRHNGNILLDMEGHLIHIDYGFWLSSSPKNLGFETAPFKLTSEIIEVMGGVDSDMFLYYKSLLLRGIMAARKHYRRIVSLAEIMSTGSKMQCFRAGIETVRSLESRFHISSTDEQLQQIVDSLVDGSRDNYTTRFYDSFQYYTNGIH